MVLKIIFNGVPNVNDHIVLHFDANYPTPPVNDFTRGNIFKTTRVYPGEVTIGSGPVSQAQNYENAFSLDYGTDFTINRVDNVVYIEANNGSNIFSYSCESSLVGFEEVTDLNSNNAIHEIIFTPKQYVYPAIMQRDYLVTEDDYFIITEDNKKIRL